MFKITHTTPERVLRHLLRLQREGEALASAGDIDFIQEGRWEWRVMQYLRRIVADERMFDRLPAYALRAVTAEELLRTPQPLTQATHGPSSRKRINTYLTTLASVIDQLEAHIEATH